MARVRLSAPAQADIAAILKTSEALHGPQARLRYRALLSAALRRIATNPDCMSSAARDELLAGLHSFHIRHSRDDSGEPPVGNAVVPYVGNPADSAFFRTSGIEKPGCRENRSRSSISLQANEIVFLTKPKPKLLGRHAIREIAVGLIIAPTCVDMVDTENPSKGSVHFSQPFRSGRKHHVSPNPARYTAGDSRTNSSNGEFNS
jgi:toxin ParE1/3/4